MAIDRLAVYTTVYPGVEPYLGDWYRSILSQSDSDFDLWVGVDSLGLDQFSAALGREPEDVNLIIHRHSSPAQIRENAIESLVQSYDAVVFVDSDDLLYPTRVAAVRAALQEHDLIGCALKIIDTQGQELGLTFAPPPGQAIASLLPCYNVFGLSNTAYRTEVLRRCLPIPADCVCIDWLLATRAWALGAGMHFDRVPQMAYRQHGANTARVLLPFTAEQVMGAASRVCNHYVCLLAAGWPLPTAHRQVIEAARERAERFHGSISQSPDRLNRYVEALNQLTPEYIWWWCVAHPNLEEIWEN